MCLAIPAKIEEINEGMAKCRVGESDTFLDVSIMLMPEEVAVGDYLIVHAGFALRKLDPQEAEESLRIMRDMIKLTDGIEANF